MTKEEFEIKVNEEVSRLVGFMLGYLMIKHSSGIAGEVVVKLFTSPGFSARIMLVLKMAVEKEMKNLEQEILDIGSGVKLDPSTQQRIIAGFINNKNTPKEEVK